MSVYREAAGQSLAGATFSLHAVRMEEMEVFAASRPPGQAFHLFSLFGTSDKDVIGLYLPSELFRRNREIYYPLHE